MKGLIIIILLLFDYNSYCQTDKIDYEVYLEQVTSKQNEFRQIYISSDSANKDSIVRTAREYLISTISNGIFQYWYGTKWDFNGTTRIPQKGNISCGYFVTNILEDVGFNIPRITWAQSASEVFIKELSNNNLKRFHNSSIQEIEDYLKSEGDGLYLIGLDYHTGFIIAQNESIKFVHANYYRPEIGVMSENIDTWNPLKHSKYRVIGKMMSEEMIIKWITNEPYK